MQNPSQPNVPKAPEGQPTQAGEQVAPVSPEVAAAPEAKPEQAMPKEPAKESVPQGGPAPVAPQVQPQDQQAQPAQAPTDDDSTSAKGIDKQFAKAADDVKDKFKDKPYEEEEAHGDLQIKYLWQRFKKKIGKNKD